MHPFFEPLDERDTMLLLTTLTVGGSEETGVFAGLAPERRARLDAKAKALLAIPKTKRVPFIVHEMKQLLAFEGLRGAERVDPSWLLQGLKGESPRVVAAVLVSLPTPAVRGILERLPAAIRQRLPSKEEMKRVSPALLADVRRLFESRFDPMPPPPSRGFAFRDVVQLEQAELYRLVRDLGLVELGQAFVSVGKMALAEFCRRLPRERAEELVVAVRGASSVDVPELKSAQRFLARVVESFDDTEELFRKAGLWRLVKASLGEDAAFRAAFRQRLPRDAGLLFQAYVEKAGEMGDLGDDVVKRLQDSILLGIRELGRRAEIAPQYATIEMTFHDPALGVPAPAGGAGPSAG